MKIKRTKKVYEKMEKMKLREILEVAEKFGISEKNLFQPHFKRWIIQMIMKDIFLNKQELKEKFLKELGGVENE